LEKIFLKKLTNHLRIIKFGQIKILFLKMYSNNLKSELFLRANSGKWATLHHNFSPDPAPISAVIFKSVKDNFHTDSHTTIINHVSWQDRLKKRHSFFTADIKEMQSSNSSDALAMNVFCHPDLSNWKGVAQLFNVQAITDINFGYNPDMLKNGIKEPTPTEVDLYLNQSIICEAKLTESDFTEKAKTSVELYDDFSTVFEVSALKQTETSYHNYQLIRNILAAYSEQKQFYLLCDARRPDLARSFFETVRCIKDVNLRLRCNILYWQDIAAACGQDLRDFLAEKYGI